MKFCFLLLLLSTTSALFSGLFPVRGVEITQCNKSKFNELSDFFTRSFWADKRNGNKLDDRGLSRMRDLQLGEFRRRYSVQRRSALLLAQRPGSTKKSTTLSSTTNIILNTPPDDGLEIIGCVAVDLENLVDLNTLDRCPNSPVMSNLAVDKQFRGRGVATKLVDAIERKVKEDRLGDSLYLKVDVSNTKARNLYKKRGYREIWKESATTMEPSMNDSGKWEMEQTDCETVVMRKTV